MHAENQTLRFLADLAGLPPSAGGCFVQGGSAANLSALAVARDTARQRGAPSDRALRIAVSEQTHSSIANTMRLLGVQPFLVATDDDRMTGPRLAQTLAADADPSSVFAVAATAGTTNAGLVDDLAGIAAVCADRDLWMHVDAAYGGAALLAPSVRDHFRGIDAADSLVIDPHKWLFAPFDCAALLYRNPALARAVHTQDASVPRRDPRRARRVEPVRLRLPTDPTRARAATVVLARRSTAPMPTATRSSACSPPRARLPSAIRAHPHLELVREPELSIVLFTRTGWTGADYDAWSARLLDEQIAFVTPSRWHGEPVARLAFLHPETTLDIVDEMLDSTALNGRRTTPAQHAPHNPRRARCASSSSASIARACAPFGGMTSRRA